jgi:NADH:ubiquinone oxidoreductase subunit 5 (subunit L)/multisubunit Na+/H+ antiporter MnhA subunit
MKFDLSLLKTILFSFGVVSFVIGVYQTLVSGNLMANYWIFMVSMCCWLPLRYWRQKEAAAAKAAAQQAAATASALTDRSGKPGRKRR